MKRKIELQKLIDNRRFDSYQDEYRYIVQLIETGRIEPIKSSPKNGKNPSLYTRYWFFEPEHDYSAEKDELLYHTDPRIGTSYYLIHLDVYIKEKQYVRMLSDYLYRHSDALKIRVSRNERSFEIWGEEKFLTEGAGKTILNHCMLSEDILNCYSTVEPFACYIVNRSVPQKILILENKDPFYGMRRHLQSGNDSILGTSIGTLIYGAGKRVISTFTDFLISAEEYMTSPSNELLYFGDLDYEGIGIYENLARNNKSIGSIKPFIPAYNAMLDKVEDISFLPWTKEKQNRNISEFFFLFFEPEIVQKMKDILDEGRYIPQEILNVTDY